ncbi:metallopeptidase family protein [Altererythrobacter sp.]|uniref:metallopeptidase family protein n=1 Tax=Altererythrobacter sp. TaxID=1872480 RepID=UPI003D032CA3
MADFFHGPDRAAFEAYARATLRQMPAAFQENLRDVVLKIEEFATAEQLASVGLDDKWHLSGLYEGRPLTHKSVWESGSMPPIISLFRQPLLAEMHQTGVSLEAIVRHVVVHEAGHHFGFSDEEMHALERRVR